jgi:hypothetical protein
MDATMNRRMRIGVVGGQKRKTEAHLFKSLEEMNIDVAWHVEAMTNREFSKDCDAIVSMVDYVGHGLFAKAKDFSKLNGIPFRQITFNWSKAKPTFEELQNKFNNMDENTMYKTVSEDPDLVKIEEISALVGYSTPTIRKAYEDGLIARMEKQVGTRIVHFYSKNECESFFAEKREQEEKKVVKQEEKKPVQSKEYMIAHVLNGKYNPIIEVASMDAEEISAAISLSGLEGEFAVITVIKKFKAQIKLTVEEV